MARTTATPAKRTPREVVVRVRPASIVDIVFLPTSEGDVRITKAGARVSQAVATELLAASNHLTTE